jgi:hypothetical protein
MKIRMFVAVHTNFDIPSNFSVMQPVTPMKTGFSAMTFRGLTDIYGRFQATEPCLRHSQLCPAYEPVHSSHMSAGICQSASRHSTRQKGIAFTAVKTSYVVYTHGSSNIRFNNILCMIRSSDWRMMSSGMWCRMGLLRTDDSEELIATIIRVEEISELASYVLWSVFLHSMSQLRVTAYVVSSSLILSTLMTEAIRSSESSVLKRPIRHHSPEYGIRHIHRHENFRSYWSSNRSPSLVFMLFLALVGHALHILCVPPQ